MKYNVSAEREIDQKPAKASRSSSRPRLTAPAPALTALHDQMGNRAVGQLVQAKLTIGAPDDKYEQEADRVADQVMRMPEPSVRRQVDLEEEDDEELLQTKPLASQITPLVQRQADGEGQTTVDTSSVEDVLRSPGQPLDEATRTFMESRFGYDFGDVRVHSGAKAVESAHSVNAKAYTVGRNVVFGASQFAPGTGAGQRLLAHELTHVAQQGHGVRASSPHNTHNPVGVEANTISSALMSDHAPVNVSKMSGLIATIQMKGPTRATLLGLTNAQYREKFYANRTFYKTSKEYTWPYDESLQDLWQAIPKNEAKIATDENTLESIKKFVDAVRAFQQENGLQPDGYIRGKTRKELKRRSSAAQSGKPKSSPRPPQQQINQTKSLLQVRGNLYGGVPGIAITPATGVGMPLQSVIQALEPAADTLEDVAKTIAGGLAGEFNEDPTFAEIGVDLGVSLIPYLDQVADGRDLVAHIYYMTAKNQYGKPLRWLALAFSLLGWVPEIGSAIKSASKFAIKCTREGIGYLGDIVKIMNKYKRLEDITDLTRLTNFINQNWSAWVKKGQQVWHSFLLNRVTAVFNLIATWAEEGRRLFSRNLQRIRELSATKLTEAFNGAKKLWDDAVAEMERLGGRQLQPAGGPSHTPHPLAKGESVSMRGSGSGGGSKGGKGAKLAVGYINKLKGNVNRIHNLLPPGRARNERTTAMVVAQDLKGNLFHIVSGGTKGLTPDQTILAKNLGFVVAPNPSVERLHGEIAAFDYVYTHAKNLKLEPIAVIASRKICPECLAELIPEGFKVVEDTVLVLREMVP